MSRVVIAVAILLCLSTVASAVPYRTVEYGRALQRESGPREEECMLVYYNHCGQFVSFWTGYCNGAWSDAPVPPQYGTCFDLRDCPEDYRHLNTMWWACRRFTPRGFVNVEVYCAGQDCCPVGAPLVGFYGYQPDMSTMWQRFELDGLELCPCEATGRRFIVLVTDLCFGTAVAPYSDDNSVNITAGCESEWRCTGHSYVYHHMIDYCAVYGTPGPLWVSGAGYGCTNYPAVPPGCHNYYYPTGFFAEFLIDCYIGARGPTRAQEESWGKVKRLFR